MNLGLRTTPEGGWSYAQIAAILLLVVGIGFVIAVYFTYRETDNTGTETVESLHDPMGIEERMLRDLAKSKNRFFSNDQVAFLKRELSPQKGESIAIECPMGDVKSCYLALEINLVFEASGWVVEEFLFAAQGRPGETLLLLVKEESMMPRAESLARLFSSVGLATTVLIDSEQLFDLKILVPSKNAQPA